MQLNTKMAPRSNTSKSPLTQIDNQTSAIKILKRPVHASNDSYIQTSQLNIALEDNTRTQPSFDKPTFKILKRPDNNNGSSSSENNSTSKVRNHAKKTFEEREALYAEARQRILGSATPNYDEEDINVTSESNLKNNFNNSKIVEVPITRLPHGPDGSKGFKVRR